MDHLQCEDWQSLYVAQRKSLIDYAARLTGSRDIAKDIVQELGQMASEMDRPADLQDSALPPQDRA